ncbi:MAG TPA: SDR family oxidoreductase, partial [Polyangiaceae bacterium]|nr:SDR family oxidoreductase [Polyangiaceae bacterium]
MITTAFVTGSTGLLGSNLVRALAARGTRVRALARGAGRARALLGDVDRSLVTIVEGDMNDVASFAPALAGADAVFHAAAYFRDGYKGGSHWEAMRRTNVDGTRALLAAAAAAGVRRFVNTSSIAVLAARGRVGPVDETMARPAEGEPDDYYRSKILQDAVVDEALRARPDLHATLVLPGFMNGPGDVGPTSAGQIVLDFLRGALPFAMDAHFSYVDARDVAAAMIAAAERGRRGERYLVAGRSLHLREALAVLARVAGRPAPRAVVPLWLLAPYALGSEAWARATGRPVLVSWSGYRTMRRECDAMEFDSGKAVRELGASFRPLEETFADAVAWFVARGLAAPPADPASDGGARAFGAPPPPPSPASGALKRQAQRPWQ